MSTHKVDYRQLNQIINIDRNLDKEHLSSTEKKMYRDLISTLIVQEFKADISRGLNQELRNLNLILVKRFHNYLQKNVFYGDSNYKKSIKYIERYSKLSKEITNEH